jgi:hypothetical protein
LPVVTIIVLTDLIFFGWWHPSDACDQHPKEPADLKWFRCHGNTFSNFSLFCLIPIVK